MAKKAKKGVKHHDLLENPEVLAEKLTKSEQFIEQHKTLILSVFGGIALIITGFFLYKYYIDNQNELAQDDVPVRKKYVPPHLRGKN